MIKKDSIINETNSNNINERWVGPCQHITQHGLVLQNHSALVPEWGHSAQTGTWEREGDGIYCAKHCARGS